MQRVCRGAKIDREKVPNLRLGLQSQLDSEKCCWGRGIIR